MHALPKALCSTPAHGVGRVYYNSSLDTYMYAQTTASPHSSLSTLDCECDVRAHERSVVVFRVRHFDYMYMCMYNHVHAHVHVVLRIPHL